MQGLRQLSTFIGQTFALWAIVFAIAVFTVRRLQHLAALRQRP